MNLTALFQSFSSRLQTIYSKQESESLVLWLFEEYLGKNRIDLFSNNVVESIPIELENALKELLKGKPIQYVTGKAPFYGREFLVNSNVLIPRNETEELVHLIIKENKNSGLRILDIGTGSGCIPITLAMELNDAEVFGLDISDKALSVASRNAISLDAEVVFQKCDILNEEIPLKHLDIIVSNPPYVKISEKEMMHENVLKHEPHLALFVDDDDPLLFYKHIGKKAKKVLKPYGRLYFEINEALGNETVDILTEYGYTEVKILEDLNGKNRMVRATFNPDS
ncbi:release factor glutamine methyltransferase [Aquiflexum balticum DSM 16537]|uniref:Release factor glutamine methyltransferase n=1 Tax=Aquiflexum balticum DSM 16537 TaxID=758820 RepID=A0A1W2H0V3_9BACT|nr:peptide chain release factor N(5)-glutamine methyltransferase [Aquiflexum balticum]SMD42560.1 release factor glutamine methyltransferase [Aquiflexum balticum DSM 16537]